MDNHGVNCPNCSALNPSKQGRCEACGSSLDWALWKSRKQSWTWPRQWTAAACLVGGLATGALVTGYFKTHGLPAAQDPNPVVVASDSRPQIDVVFVIDTTGSMADEIDVVKTQVRDMMNKVQSGQPRPYVRFGVVAFRDRGDSYVTKSYPLTSELASIQAAVNELTADGGGDTPESVNEALHAGLEGMNWNFDQKTRKLLFLIGDAAPHMDYQGDFDYRDEMKFAKSKGIKIHTWGCSGITDCGEPEFKEMARLGGGDFQFLTYRQEVVKADGSKANMLFQGSQAYEAPATAKWKEGAINLAPSERKAIDATVVSAPGAGSMPRYGAASGYRIAPSAKMENNLDVVLTKQVMDEGRSAGVKY